MAHNPTPRKAHKTKYVFSIVALALAVILCGSGVWAWLAYNVDLSSSGMELTASASANVVIATTMSAITDNNILNTASPFAVTFTTAAETVQPCTHVTGAGTHNLQYCETPEDIAYDTGLPLSGDTEDLADLLENVPEQSTGYFHDYTVYIGAVGEELSAVRLIATVTATDSTATMTDTFKALSVDFYVGDNEDTIAYSGTLNLAGVRYNNYTTASSAIEIFRGNIPKNNVNPLVVTMRVYFDGGLQKDETSTYVTSKTLSTEDLAITVHFEAKSY